MPRPVLLPLIVFFSVLGVYAVTLSAFDIVMMVVLALGATWMRLMRYPLPPLVLAFVLGPMLEENLRRSLILSDGSIVFLWQRPTTAVLVATTVVLVVARLLRVRAREGERAR